MRDELGVEREERRDVIKDMWLKCHTAEEIGEAVGLDYRQAEREISDISSGLKKSPKVTFSEPDYAPPIYNVWAFGVSSRVYEKCQ